MWGLFAGDKQGQQGDADQMDDMRFEYDSAHREDVVVVVDDFVVLDSVKGRPVEDRGVRDLLQRTQVGRRVYLVSPVRFCLRLRPHETFGRPGRLPRASETVQSPSPDSDLGQ